MICVVDHSIDRQSLSFASGVKYPTLTADLRVVGSIEFSNCLPYFVLSFQVERIAACPIRFPWSFVKISFTLYSDFWHLRHGRLN